MSVVTIDPKDSTIAYIGSGAESHYGIQVGPVRLRVHPASKCAGRACVIHSPSDHRMRSWRLNWRGDTGIMERLCPEHGVGHPDPDDLAFNVAAGRSWVGVHGCCGCCWTTQ